MHVTAIVMCDFHHFRYWNTDTVDNFSVICNFHLISEMIYYVTSLDKKITLQTNNYESAEKDVSSFVSFQLSQ